MSTALSFAAGIALVLALLALKNVRQLYCPNWVLRALGETPWAPGMARHMRAVPDGGMQPTHEVYFVPRQEIAECGIACPKCAAEVAERGDFSRVVRSFVDGRTNEVVKCLGLIDTGDGSKPVPCPAWLAASPNTEHGDQLIEGDPDEFYVFNRITAQQALAERYGVDISADDHAALSTSPKARPEGATPGDDIIAGAFPSYAVAAALADAQAAQVVAAAAAAAGDETRILPVISDPPKDA